MNEKESLKEIRQENAHVFAANVKDAFGIELGCDRAGVGWLDSFILSRSDVMDAVTLSDLGALVGCLLIAPSQVAKSFGKPSRQYPKHHLHFYEAIQICSDFSNPCHHSGCLGQ